MNEQIKSLCEQLEKEISDTYDQGVSLAKAERLAAKFLSASIVVGNELSTLDLDRRMKKSTLKSARAGVYLNEATATDKKPSDKLIEAKIDTDESVDLAQMAYDRAEVACNKLTQYLDIFHEAHIYYRGISKQTGFGV